MSASKNILTFILSPQVLERKSKIEAQRTIHGQFLVSKLQALADIEIDEDENNLISRCLWENEISIILENSNCNISYDYSDIQNLVDNMKQI